LERRKQILFFSSPCLLVRLANEPQRTAILKAAKTAKEHKTKIVFDPGAHNLIRSEPRLFARALDFCDVFLPNLDEASEITNMTNMDKIIRTLRNKASLTAIKCGKNGCILINKKEIVKMPSHKVNCVDSTGAGDAFNSALIFGLFNGLTLENIGRFANWFAGEVAKHLGARSFPSKSRIRKFLEQMSDSGCNPTLELDNH
jgi:sugar/nucleoside kinase (ribokinase family)